jgi:hypothetical protein
LSERISLWASRSSSSLQATALRNLDVIARGELVEVVGRRFSARSRSSTVGRLASCSARHSRGIARADAGRVEVLQVRRAICRSSRSTSSLFRQHLDQFIQPCAR